MVSSIWIYFIRRTCLKMARCLHLGSAYTNNLLGPLIKDCIPVFHAIIVQSYHTHCHQVFPRFTPSWCVASVHLRVFGRWSTPRLRWRRRRSIPESFHPTRFSTATSSWIMSTSLIRRDPTFKYSRTWIFISPLAKWRPSLAKAARVWDESNWMGAPNFWNTRMRSWQTRS